ncbi:hypothetical protein KC19_VG256800 [Ceratodon purpureus]|uniref:Uncharacterized protein n=1 Tax=Ceratodon purpureus TaxID=3225 RepID=A0A8T0HV71_CERPU|nr:hypothetical protein KC19_VG256800 [Ceratodon purpureus]
MNEAENVDLEDLTLVLRQAHHLISAVKGEAMTLTRLDVIGVKTFVEQETVVVTHQTTLMSNMMVARIGGRALLDSTYLVLLNLAHLQGIMNSGSRHPKLHNIVRDP